MVSKRDQKLVLWPAYFDVNEARPWRRVPKRLAIENPTVDDIARVAAALRLRPVIEKGVAHPHLWYARSGRVLVDIRGAKTVLIQQIAERLKGAAPTPESDAQ